MSHKAKTQPLCRYCGRAIAKHTHYVRFGSMAKAELKTVRPQSRAEAQAYVNTMQNEPRQIVSLRWAMKFMDGYTHDHVPYASDISTMARSRRKLQTRDYIDYVGTWDGESYTDPFFCNGRHASDFAYVCARITDPAKLRLPIGLPAYHAAADKQGTTP